MYDNQHLWSYVCWNNNNVEGLTLSIRIGKVNELTTLSVLSDLVEMTKIDLSKLHNYKYN
jgi:hypothetical protein